MRGLSAVLVAFLLPFGTPESSGPLVHTYLDVFLDDPYGWAVELLTDQGAIEGYDDGMFRPNKLVNRAEFVKIVLALRGDLSDITPKDGDSLVSCFPDVPPDAWYAEFVCAGKALGLVSGNALPGLAQDQYPFVPERTVNAAEALKILTHFFALEVLPGGATWYEPYMRAAAVRGFGTGLEPGDALTRSEVALLTAQFFTFDEPENVGGQFVPPADVLEELLGEQSSSIPGGSGESMSDEKSMSGGSQSSIGQLEGATQEEAVSYDPFSDTEPRAQFLLLGRVSSMLGAAKVFITEEAIDVRRLSVTFVAAPTSIDSLLLYDGDRRYLGKASLDNSEGSGKVFALDLGAGSVEVPRREEWFVYARAILKPHDAGGVSGEDIQIDSFRVQGDGVWSNTSYSRSSSETFLTFETSRSHILAIQRTSELTDVLISGSGHLLSTFEFSGNRGDGGADLRLTDLTFTIEESGGVAVSDVKLRRQGGGAEHTCTVVGKEATCSSVSASMGSFKSEPLEFSVYGDVVVPGGINKASLRMTINDPGTPSQAGAVTWTDGVANFSWVSFDQPVSRGTSLKY